MGGGVCRVAGVGWRGVVMALFGTVLAPVLALVLALFCTVPALAWSRVTLYMHSSTPVQCAHLDHTLAPPAPWVHPCHHRPHVWSGHSMVHTAGTPGRAVGLTSGCTHGHMHRSCSLAP